MRLWGVYKWCNIRVSGIPEEKNETEEIFEVIMAVNFSKLMTDTKLQIQESQRTPSRMTTKKYKT